MYIFLRKNLFVPTYQLPIINSYTSHYCFIVVYIEMIDSTPFIWPIINNNDNHVIVFDRQEDKNYPNEK